ncbi:MAG: tRNA (adenosine(37)-N6)-dimethylallyltransferase MiaA [Clostridiales bacterium]|nr:tRNA (adenosine(37)-N6)-dimethylallyltransferase MiaA [Clostridiales bacterium]
MNHSEKKPLIILTGPTAVGKTELSLSLAERVGGAIISADSMQVYRGMDIGSAKIRPDEMRGIPHYLIDVLNPEEEFNVVLFQKLAKEALTEIYRSGRVPIVVGGTGFYIQALVYDIDFTEQDEDRAIREHYERIAAGEGAHALHEMLAAVDPDSAEAIHENNVKRTIRALEYYEKSGQPISEHNAGERTKESPYDFRYFVLTDDRDEIYRRIDARADEMLSAGLLDEVRTLKDRGCRRGMTSMQGLGYKELLDYVDGLTSYDEAVRLIKRDTRHFAKRQLTWFRREKDVIWINKADFNKEEDILDKIISLIRAPKN